MNRVIYEKAFDVDKKYVEICGASCDTKPTEGIVTGSIYKEVDTGHTFMFDETTGAWYDSANASKTLITAATVTLGSALSYTGEELTQAVSSVKIGATTLSSGTDYKIENNKATLPGTYTMLIIGIGSYAGIIAQDFTVSKGAGSVSVDPSTLTLTAEGDAGTATISVTGDGEVSVSSSAEDKATAVLEDTTVTVTPIAEGNATVTITLTASDLYTGDTATIAVTVEAAADPDPTP